MHYSYFCTAVLRFVNKAFCLPVHPFFDSVLRPFQDYFSIYETGQSVDGRKRENTEKKPPGTPASRTWLVSHEASARLKPTPDTAVK